MADPIDETKPLFQYKGETRVARVYRENGGFRVRFRAEDGIWRDTVTTMGDGRFNTKEMAQRKARAVAGIPQPEQCKHTRTTGVITMTRCSRDAVRDGYCTRHHSTYISPADRRAMARLDAETARTAR